MNKVIEATCKDGTRALVSPATIKRFADGARECANGVRGRVTKLLVNRLASFMYVNDYVKLVEINYDGNGNQKRVTIMARR